MNKNNFNKKVWSTPKLLILNVNKTKSGVDYNKNEHAWKSQGPVAS